MAARGIVPVEGASGEAGDEVDLRLALDEKGDAKGTFTVLLHGRTAQTLAEAFNVPRLAHGTSFLSEIIE